MTLENPTRRSITTWREFQNEVRIALEQAAAARAEEIWLCDADFKQWPLGEPGVVESLTRWARSKGRLTLLAQRFDEINRSHGRWIEWRRVWSHRVDCRTFLEHEVVQAPSLCLVPGCVSVRLADPVHGRGIASTDAADEVPCRELIDAVLQRSIEAFPATTLGL